MTMKGNNDPLTMTMTAASQKLKGHSQESSSRVIVIVKRVIVIVNTHRQKSHSNINYYEKF